ncbi:uncharacterized protein LOC125946374 [Dermacentor silvarum]|uniref:uncharacterized protein LOC125946374 n=1 Tax=Dermacentor silvarum TaxID=543639 RepID=UPI002101B91C|nr:uncharacterized protein LOC125946374 [Dermacentor silvarum]
MPAQAHAAPSEEQDSGSEQQGFHDRSGECQKQHEQEENATLAAADAILHLCHVTLAPPIPAEARAASAEEQDTGTDMQDFNDTSGERQKHHVSLNAVECICVCIPKTHVFNENQEIMKPKNVKGHVNCTF